LGPAAEGGSVTDSDVAFSCWFGCCIRSMVRLLVWLSRNLSSRDAVLFGDRAGDGRLLGVVGSVCWFGCWFGDDVVDVFFVNYTTLGSGGW